MPAKRVTYVSIGNIRGALNDNEVIICFYGTRGGLRSSENLTVEQAQLLRDGLNRAIAELTP